MKDHIRTPPTPSTKLCDFVFISPRSQHPQHGKDSRTTGSALPNRAFPKVSNSQSGLSHFLNLKPKLGRPILVGQQSSQNQNLVHSQRRGQQGCIFVQLRSWLSSTRGDGGGERPVTDLSRRVRLLSLAKIAGDHGHAFQVRPGPHHNCIPRHADPREYDAQVLHDASPTVRPVRPGAAGRSPPLVYFPSTLPLNERACPIQTPHPRLSGEQGMEEWCQPMRVQPVKQVPHPTPPETARHRPPCAERIKCPSASGW